MALKLSQGSLTTYSNEHLLAGEAGRAYIQSVDQSVAAALKGENSYLNYLLSTLLIEERANEIYPFYADLMDSFGMAGPIRGILREEEHHLEEIQHRLVETQSLSSQKLDALRMIEQRAFEFLMDSVAMSLGIASDWDEQPIFSSWDKYW